MFNLFKNPQTKQQQKAPEWAEDLCKYFELEEVPYCSAWPAVKFFLRAYINSLPWTTTFFKSFIDYNENDYYILAAIRENLFYLAGKDWDQAKSVEENIVDVYNVHKNNKDIIKNVFLEMIELGNIAIPNIQ